jgi:hypothetical protein
MAHRRFHSAMLFLAAACLVAAPIGASAERTAKSAPTKSTPETALHRIQRTVARLDDEAKTPEGEAAVVKRLSAQLGAPEDSLRRQHAAWGLGYGEIAMAYGFSRASRTGKTPDDVIAMRNQGKDWLVIAKNLGVKVDRVAARMKRHVPPAKAS